MRADEFTSQSPGELVAIPRNGLAFVPRPLPRGLQLGPATIRLLGNARARLGVLVEGVRSLPNHDLLIRPFQKREAVLSSRIEGTRTTLEDAFADDAAEQPDADDDAREVRNYERALVHAVRGLANGRPLSVFLVRELHRELLDGVRGESKQPGQFRRDQVWLGGPASDDDLRQARFVPPPPEHVNTCIDDLQQYLEAPPHDDPLIRIALTHYQFETIHPFLDGNGRVGRLLIALQMIAEGLMQQPWLYVSPFLERERDAYYRGLFRLSATGDYAGWIEWFLGAVLASASDTIDRLHALRALEQEFRARLQDLRTQKPALLLPTLFANPFLTIAIAQQQLGVPTAATAQQAVNRLVARQIVEPIDWKPRGGRGRRPTVYRCTAILRALQG